MIYNKGGTAHTRLQRRLEADAVYHCRYSFVENTNLLAVVKAKMMEERLSFSHAADLVGIPVSTLYKWKADLPLSPSTLLQDHQVPPSFIHDIEPQLLPFIHE
jgi:hypothetical protein